MRVLDKLPTLTALVRDRTVRLAVTGLSHSGKTAFITSIVYNLLGAVGRPARLPFLRAAADRRILAARLLTPGDDAVPQFPLDQTIAALAGDPPAALPRSPSRSSTIPANGCSTCRFCVRAMASGHALLSIWRGAGCARR